MTQFGQTNGGFRPRYLRQSTFNSTVAKDLGTIADALTGMRDTQTKQGEFMADMSARIDGHGQSLDRLKGMDDALYRDFCDFRARTFRERLRWLFFGR